MWDTATVSKLGLTIVVGLLKLRVLRQNRQSGQCRLEPIERGTK
jgi:hypothetical protein